jgi:phage-related baseplate assembly protein
MSSDLHPIHELHAQGAPKFVEAEASILLNQLKAHFEVATGRTLSPSQTEMYLLETAAYMFAVSGAETQIGFENCFVAWAQEQFLEARGVGRNVLRLTAQPATTTLYFEAEGPVVADLLIPKGTRVSDSAGQVEFATLEDSKITKGESAVLAKAEALKVGSFGNGLAVGTLMALVDTVVGIATVSNTTETGNGSDLEDLERYRGRVALAFEQIGDGLSKERYLSDVLAWNARCVAVEITRPQPGHVNIYPLMNTGAPNTEELASLRAVFDTSNIHQGDYIQALAPTSHEFDVNLHLILSDPLAEEPAVAAVNSVLSSWSQLLGGFIAPSELVRAAKSQAGVIEAQITGIDLTGVAPTAWRKGTLANVTHEVRS